MPSKTPNIPAISDAELDILQVLWCESPLPADDIIKKLQSQRKAHPRTIKTLISRLLKKGALTFTEQDRKYHYSPLISKEEFYQTKTDSFLQRFFDGQLSPLVSFFSKHNRLSEGDIKELKLLIKKIEADDGN